jgi:hypothetical protein
MVVRDVQLVVGQVVKVDVIQLVPKDVKAIALALVIQDALQVAQHHVLELLRQRKNNYKKSL